MEGFEIELFLNTLKDINDSNVDIPGLAEKYHLILITLKSAECPVCPLLLKTINRYGLNDSIYEKISKEDIDPFILEPPEINLDFYRLLLRNDTFFIILSPGPKERLKEIQEDTQFQRYPFIVDENLTISKKIGMQLSQTQIWPAIIHIEPSLKYKTIHYGRGPGFYGISLLISYLQSLRIEIESHSIDILHNADLVLSNLNLRIKSSTLNKASGSYPTELWLLIFEHLTTNELAIIAKTCRTLNSLVLYNLEFKIRKYSNKVRRLLPKPTNGETINQKNFTHYAFEDVLLDKQPYLIRKEITISYLRNISIELKSLITTYMILSKMELPLI